MCGIAGVYDHSGSGTADVQNVGAMLERLIHRGPDDEGTYQDKGVSIGARRLSIIDVAGGHQPIANEDGSIVVALNGEIYNFAELRDELEAQGHRFRTNCDTEVIVHAYEQDGEDCVARLRGMFAFVIWNARERQLIVARDRVGIKPLYWTDDGRRFLFASEIKALLACETVHADVDLEALAAMLALRYVPTPKTMFRNIRSLAPGHMLVVDSGGVRTRQWWDLEAALPTDGPHLSESEEVERLRIMLREVVRSHMVSDVPYGAFLSGGVDSSSIVALMTLELG